MTVSSLLPQDCERRLVDCNVQELTDEHIQWADMVFVTGMLVQKKFIHEIMRRVKALGKIVVIGGPYASTSMEETLYAHHVFVGEAEQTLPEFFQDLANGTARKIYECGEDNRPDMATSPMPDFSLINIGHYVTMSLQFCRGCPFDCEFCDITKIFGHDPRTKGIPQFLAELDALKATGYRGSLFIVDDNFIGNKKTVRLLVPELVKWQRENGFPFSLFTEASLNLAEDSALLQTMKDAGFRRVFLGIETPVVASLKETHKLQNTRRDILESVQIIQGYGIEVMAGFIVGFDNDPPDIFDRMANFINDSGIPMAMLGMLSALPGTDLWKRLKAEGRLVNDGNGSNTELNIVPKMGADVLIAGYHEVLRKIFSPSTYYKRSLKCLDRLPADMPTEHSFFRAMGILYRIFMNLGIKDRNRLHFWWYICRAAFYYPEKLTQALTFAVMGHHFARLVPQAD